MTEQLMMFHIASVSPRQQNKDFLHSVWPTTLSQMLVSSKIGREQLPVPIAWFCMEAIPWANYHLLEPVGGWRCSVSSFISSACLTLLLSKKICSIWWSHSLGTWMLTSFEAAFNMMRENFPFLSSGEDGSYPPSSVSGEKRSQFVG